MIKCIIVNATALDSGGALNILTQFVENIPQDNKHWLLFVSDRVNIVSHKSNVKIVQIEGVKPIHKRFIWDVYGLSAWLKKHKIYAVAKISLQNTGFRCGKNKIPSFIYYHQSLPFYPYGWRLFKSNERKLWFYKHIYPLFVKLFLTQDTKVFVQLNFIKEGFCNYFSHPKDNVEVFSPSITLPTTSLANPYTSESLNLFYPSSPVFYKNHDILISALDKCKENIGLYLTIPRTGTCKNSQIHFLGSLTYNEVCSYYQYSDALLFPSYIETYGLPLIEAASIGLPIIAADLPYAREVLKGYDGVKFVNHNDASKWLEAIHELKKGTRFTPLDISNRSSWQQLFQSIENHLQNIIK